MSTVSRCCTGNVINGECDICGKPCESVQGYYRGDEFTSFDQHAINKLTARAEQIANANPYTIVEFASDDKGFSMIYYVEGDDNPRFIGLTMEQFAELAQQAGWWTRQYPRNGFVEETDEDFSNEETVEQENATNWKEYWSGLTDKYFSKWHMDTLIKYARDKELMIS